MTTDPPMPRNGFVSGVVPAPWYNSTGMDLVSSTGIQAPCTPCVQNV